MQNQVAELKIVSLIGPAGWVFSKNGINDRGMVPGRIKKISNNKGPGPDGSRGLAVEKLDRSDQ
jgi:hypothetical protein